MNHGTNNVTSRPSPETHWSLRSLVTPEQRRRSEWPCEREPQDSTLHSLEGGTLEVRHPFGFSVPFRWTSTRPVVRIRESIESGPWSIDSLQCNLEVLSGKRSTHEGLKNWGLKYSWVTTNRIRWPHESVSCYLVVLWVMTQDPWQDFWPHIIVGSWKFLGYCVIE